VKAIDAEDENLDVSKKAGTEQDRSLASPLVISGSVFFLGPLSGLLSSLAQDFA
jgi:hypothetical protein